MTKRNARTKVVSKLSRRKQTARKTSKLTRSKPADTPASVRAAEKKITILEGELHRAKEVTAAVLDEELERSKKLAVQIRAHLQKIRL